MKLITELQPMIDALHLPARGQQYLKRVATSPPSRRAQSMGTNVVCRFPSRKMGVVMQAESHRYELALVYVLEHDPSVVAFWDQPEAIKISYLSANGRQTSPTITPDFLVLRETGVEWIEVKPSEALPALAREMPHRYMTDSDGKWSSPPADATAKDYGFAFRIWTEKEVSQTWLQNIGFLSEYFDADPSAVPVATMSSLKEAVKTKPGLSLADLRRGCKEATVDHIHILIAREELYVDLNKDPLTDPERVRIYASRELAEALRVVTQGQGDNGKNATDILRFDIGHTCEWDGQLFTVGNHSHEQVTLLKDGAPVHLSNEAFKQYIQDGQIGMPGRRSQSESSRQAVELLAQASDQDLAIANHRHRVLTDEVYAAAHPAPKRTLRRWRRLYRLAEERYGHGLLGLLPQHRDRGNRYQRFSDDLMALVEQIIDEVYSTPTRPNKRYAYERLLLECAAKGFPSPSYPFFTKRVRERSKYRLALARQGKRAAHKYELIRPGEPNDNHGAYPWDVCMTDHTLLDLEAVSSESGVNLGRAWLSTLIDGFSRRVLAFCLTFDPPSYRTLMMLMRRCVERHGRLPRSLVTDGGKEFRSVYFETLTAAYEILLKRRPPGKARFGSVIERFFGSVNTMLINALSGNTQNTKAIRQLVKSMDPKRHAVHSLEDQHRLLSTFFFQIYDRRPHPTLDCSPAEQYQKGIEQAGARAHRAVANDEVFQLMTLPSTPKGTAKIQAGLGIKIHGFYYWSEEMRTLHLEGQNVRVKFDPEDLGVAFAYLGSRWVQCRPNARLGLDGKTQKELQLATLAFRRSRQLLGHRQSDSNRELAEFLKSAEAAKELSLQREKDRAQKRIWAGSNDSVEIPESRPSAGPPDGESPPAPPPPIQEQQLPDQPPQDYGDF